MILTSTPPMPSMGYAYIGISFHSTFNSFYREVGIIVAPYVNNRIVVSSAKIYLAIRMKIK